MNPDTKLTTEELKIICTRHDIAYKNHHRITTGFSHEVHRLNDDLVIKLFNKETNKNYLCEKSVLQINNTNLLKPDLIAYFDGSDDERSYLIMKYIEGKSLGGVWHVASDAQREDIICDISQTLRAFQSINPDDLQVQRYKSWQDYFDYKTDKLLGRLLSDEIMSEDKLLDVRAAFAKVANIFPSNELLPVVYWDIHFDNFIVDDSFKLKAIIDLENVRTLPIDYPLFVIRRQMEQPHKYLTEKDEKFANVRDYAHLQEWYQKYYPEMFAVKYPEERVLTYQLLDELHLMIDWSHDGELRESFARLLDRFKRL